MIRKRKPFLIFINAPLCFGLLLASVASQSADAQDATTGAGALLAGVAKFNGTPPERLPINMTPTKGGSRDECSVLHKEPQLNESAIVSDDGGLANVFVYVKKGLKKNQQYPMPAESAVLNQSGCMYQPRVQGVRVGQDLVIRNNDKLTHNTRSYAFRNRAFNIAQPAESEDRTKVFKKPEKAIQMGCDIHGWMKAFVFAMDHPFFAVTDEKGQFKIAGLPAGDYTVAAWHEDFGEQEAKITVGSTDLTDIGFSFQANEQ